MFLRYKDPCIYYSAFYICLYHMRFSQQIVQGFEDSAHLTMLALIDFKRSDFAFSFFSFGLQAFRLSLAIFILDFGRSDFTYYVYGFGLKGFRLRLDIFILDFRHSNITFASTIVKRSDYFFVISGLQTSPSYGSNVQILSASHLLAPQLRRSNIVFCRLGIQTSPSYG